MLSSSVFEPSGEIRHLHFHFHMYGVDNEMGRLRLEAFSSAGWTELWARTGAQGVNWKLAVVHLQPNVTAVRFVGTTPAFGWYSDMALDGITTGLTAVEFEHLTCDFLPDSCLWQSTGASSWQLAGSATDPWLEASGNSSQAPEWILSAALFNTTEEKVLLFDYQLSGSETVALELQHKTSAGGWQRLLLESGDRSTVWHTAIVTIPEATVGLRFVANVTTDLDMVKLDSLWAMESAGALADVSCTFEQDTCKWAGDWQRRSHPSADPTHTGPEAAFHAESYVYTGGIGDEAFLSTSPGVHAQSPVFPKLVNVSYLEFAYHMLGTSVGKLELWRRLASGQGDAPNRGGDAALRELCGASGQSSEVALDAILAWEGPEAAPAEFLSLSSTNAHNCAVLKAEGLLKCWGYGGDGRLGYGSEENVGMAPGQMGENLPVVDLGEPGVRVTEVSCGAWHTCAVLETGVVKCFGSWSGRLGHGAAFHIGDDPFEMGVHLPATDLGPGVDVVQVAAGWGHTCALLRGCELPDPGYPESRGNDPGEMGSELPAVDLGTDFQAAQLALADSHSCALSSQGAVKCWGQSDRLGLGLGDSGVYIGASPNQMGDALPAVDLGPLPAQITAGFSHACVVLSDGAVKCWGRNHVGQLGHGNLEDAGEQPGEMGVNLPATDLGDGMTVVRITSGGDHTCAILQDASLKCWGLGASGQPGPQSVRLGQGNTQNLGDEPSEMGSNLRAVDFGNLEVRDVSAGTHHTCVLLDDDSTRCGCALQQSS
ncbi:HERC4 [Symbiodinium sp. CCMP2456]|nr:HERC4 [Symbiodinium sp. CCMP2456]